MSIVKKVIHKEFSESEVKDYKEEIKDIFEQPYSEFHVTEKTKNNVLNNSNRYIGCDVRIRKGKFYTDEELENYIKESLKRPLPGKEKRLSFENHKN